MDYTDFNLIDMQVVNVCNEGQISMSLTPDNVTDDVS